MLEFTAGGTQPVVLPNGERRAFLQDGDEITFRGKCRRNGHRTITRALAEFATWQACGENQARAVLVPEQADPRLLLPMRSAANSKKRWKIENANRRRAALLSTSSPNGRDFQRQ
jgi:hypothetical protein